MKYLHLLPLGLALLTASCENQTASTNPYQSNPYYGPSGSSYGKSSSDYSSTASSSSYPSYSQSTYTPPTEETSTSTPAPSVPSGPTYAADPPSYSGSSAASASTTPYISSSAEKTHTVAGGENLYRISVANNTSVAAIKSANGLSNDTIHPGQVLKIP